MRKHTFQLTWTMFRKKLYLSVPFFLIGLILAAFSACMGIVTMKQPMYSLSMVLRASMFVFILFLFLSFEFFSLQKSCGIEETLKGTRNGFFMLNTSQFLLMVLFNAVLTVSLFFALAIPHLFSGNVHMEYLWHLAGNMVLNFFGISLLGTLIGMFAALTLPRLPAYLFLVAFTLLATPVCNIVVSQLYNDTGIYAYPIYNLFDIFPPATNVVPSPSFGYSLLSYRVQQQIFWCFLFGFLVFLALAVKRKRALRAASCACAVLCIAGLVCYLQPASKVLLNDDTRKGIAADFYYYSERTERKEEPAVNFQITEYAMDMKVRRDLSVKAILTVDNQNLKQYKFTLYHGYAVSSAKDQDGNALKFEREMDYLTIHADRPVTKIQLTYKGNSPKFFSNAQGIALPGFFPYYPQSGIHKIYHDNFQGFSKLLCPTNTNFTVRIDAPEKVFCNLPQTDEQTFSGKSDGLTLMSGFLSTKMVEGTEVVYPYLDTVEFSDEAIHEAVTSNKALGNIPPNIKKIFVLPNVNLASPYENCASYSDHMTVVQLMTIANYYPKQKVLPQKQEMFTLLYYCQTNPKYFLDDLSSGKPLNEDSIHTQFALKLKKLGNTEMLKKCSDYLFDNSDTRNISTFLKSL